MRGVRRLHRVVRSAATVADICPPGDEFRSRNCVFLARSDTVVKSQTMRVVPPLRAGWCEPETLRLTTTMYTDRLGYSTAMRSDGHRRQRSSAVREVSSSRSRARPLPVAFVQELLDHHLDDRRLGTASMAPRMPSSEPPTSSATMTITALTPTWRSMTFGTSRWFSTCCCSRKKTSRTARFAARR